MKLRFVHLMNIGVRVGEKTLAAAALWWGFILLLPLDTFSTSRAYEPMSAVASEGQWGLLFIFLGIGHVVGIFTSFLYVVQVTLLVATTIWTFIATMMLIGAPMSTGSGVYMVLAYLSASVYYKVGDGTWN